MVHVPAGSPVSCTLPVAVEQVGCVTVPMVGAEGVGGCVLIVVDVEAAEVHPTELVTV
ncbi:MAG: hypothetical protein U0X58_12570 [Flavobacteriaceae bacterium]